MEHIHNCETPFYSDCPACRIEKAAPDLLEACKLIDQLSLPAEEQNVLRAAIALTEKT